MLERLERESPIFRISRVLSTLRDLDETSEGESQRRISERFSQLLDSPARI